MFFNSEIKLLQEQLYEAGNIAAMAELANKWLMHWLNKNKWIDYKDRITLTANLIVKNAGLVNVERLAEYACMSIRNFERIFMNKTGMSPK
jgi:AraC-like DNA-binding protein